jgi:hypothetical protein
MNSMQEIQITGVYFRNNPAKQELESYPKRMLYGDREYTFTEPPMRYLIQKGQELFRLFDATDGQRQYRLRLDGQDHWSLVTMKPVS